MHHNVFVSRGQGEFHPEPLTEPYVIVSHHTALLIQILPFNSNNPHANDKISLDIVSELGLTIYMHLSGYFCTACNDTLPI